MTPATSSTIQLQINGEPRTIPAGQPLGVALAEGDQLEILRIVAGG